MCMGQGHGAVVEISFGRVGVFVVLIFLGTAQVNVHDDLQAWIPVHLYAICVQDLSSNSILKKCIILTLLQYWRLSSCPYI